MDRSDEIMNVQHRDAVMNEPASIRLPSSQRGAALLVLLAIFFLMASMALFKMMPTKTVTQQTNEFSSDNLAKAKEALLAHVIVNGYNVNQLGRFPCPDVDDYDGNAANNGTQAATGECAILVGRIPYNTIQLDLRDAVDGNGNLLWYAISKPFSRTDVNADTLPLLDNTGQDVIVAAIFSPGVALDGQSRTTTPQMTDYANYLEQVEEVSGVPKFPAASPPTDANDRWVTVSRKEIIDLIQRQLLTLGKQCLSDYAAATGGKYPWAAPMTDTSGYAGSCGNYSGRFPFGGTQNYTAPDCSPYVPAVESTAAWCVDSRNIVALCEGAGGGSCGASVCSSQKDKINDGAGHQGKCEDKTSDASCSMEMENLAQCNTACCSWSFTTDNGATTTNIYDAALDNLTQNACESHPASGGEDSALLTDYTTLSNCTKLQSVAGSWKMQLLYHVASGFVADGGTVCGGGTPCFSLNSSADTNVQAVLVAAGITLTGQARTTATDWQNQDNYVEEPNRTTFATTNTGGNYASIPNTSESATFNDVVACPTGTGC